MTTSELTSTKEQIQTLTNARDTALSDIGTATSSLRTMSILELDASLQSLAVAEVALADALELVRQTRRDL